MGCSHKTVGNIYNLWLDEGNTITRRQNCGRKKCTTLAEDEAIVRSARANPWQSSRKILNELNLNICDKTVRRRLHDNGIDSYWAARKETLTQRHKETRVGFALQYLPYTEENWRNVVFSDESCIQIMKNGRTRIWRRKGERLDEGFLQEVQRSGRFSVPVWG